MRWVAVVALLALAGSAPAANLTLQARSIEAAAWRADGVVLTVVPPDDLQLRVATITVAGRPLLRNLQLHCRRLQTDAGTCCDDASVAVTLAGMGRLQGRLHGHYLDPLHWSARLVTPQLQLALEQVGTVLNADLTATQLGYSEASGRYAAEKLAGAARLRWDGKRARLTLDLRDGEAYVEPLYFDFNALPLKLTAALSRAGAGWRIENLLADQGSAGTLELSGLLDGDLQPTQLDARLDASDLAPLMATDLQPFLIGTLLEGLSAGGAASATLSMRHGGLTKISARLSGASFDAQKSGLAFDDIHGEFNWAATGPRTGSQLQWRSGLLHRVPLGESAIAFIAHGADFALTAPWRQPLLGGALNFSRLALRDIGGDQPGADVDGTVEPINLAALSQALGWPEFGGTLGGRLPGLKRRDQTWSIDGALDAEAFDGSVRIANLRVDDPFGAQPQLQADVQFRRLDLDRVTGAFAFGRITGRLDGEITGLRLLDWNPVSFDARLYSTPGYSGSRRISQRAIDTLSSIGGGPGGLVSRSFLRLFDDFAYARLGIACVLRDGICEMDGIEPVKSKTGASGYYLVKGRLLPRIDVVGYARRVSWSSLIGQLQAAQASDGPEVKKPVPRGSRMETSP